MKSRMYFVALMMVLAIMSAQAQELLNYPLDTVNGEEVYKYQVEKSIGLYRIGVNFNVSQNEIVRLNPQLRERGLHYGETLLIPTGRKVEKKAAVEPLKEERPAMPEKSDSAIKVEEDAKVETAVVIMEKPDSILPEMIIPDHRRVVELALMLPFESQQTKRSVNAERMMEFYQGALLALKDLQNDSTLYRLHVYDTERSERKIKALCDSGALDNMKGILGLVYPIQVERMAAWCDAHKVPLLLPFSDDIDLDSHPQVMQFNSTDKQESDHLCSWITSRIDSTHCIVLDVRDADITPTMRAMRKQMRVHDIPYIGLPLHDLMNDSAAYALDSVRENLFILHSDRFQHVRIILPQIAKLQAEGFKVRIVSQYSWQKENINLPQVYTSMFTMTEDQEAYDAKWKEIFVNEHVSEAPRYDLLGYDLMQALIGWLNGKSEHKGLQSVIAWEKIHDGGYQNAIVQVKERL